ncbi:hypothetical protein NH8B_1406 [Pseudogulbenkiania sp. NH8B]|nr:hypothetical protein NH8B_1406 [Pseudogulbenkiania sp. NH8B]
MPCRFFNMHETRQTTSLGQCSVLIGTSPDANPRVRNPTVNDTDTGMGRAAQEAGGDRLESDKAIVTGSDQLDKPPVAHLFQEWVDSLAM